MLQLILYRVTFGYCFKISMKDLNAYVEKKPRKLLK